MTPRLPVACHLQPGESLPGLFSRAVVTNSYGSPGALAPWFGLPQRPLGLQREDMRHLATGDVDVQQLAQFTEHTPEEIESAAVKLDPPCPGGRYDGYVNMHRWRYCPTCVQAGKSHQRSWLLAFVTACPEHGCELVDACQNCGRPNAVNQVLMPYCGSCQTYSKARQADPREIECSATLNRLLLNHQELQVVLDRLMTVWYLSTSESLRPHFRFSPQLQTVVDMRKRVIRLWPAARTPSDLATAIDTQIQSLTRRWPHFPFAGSLLLNRARIAGAVLPPKSSGPQCIEMLGDDDPWWVPIQTAANIASVSTHTMRPLVDKKLIRSKLFTDIAEDGNRHKFRMVDLNHWHETVEQLYQQATPVEDATGLTNIMMVPLHEVLQGVRNGKMSVFRGESNLLSHLMVKFRETKMFSLRQSKPAGTLSTTEVGALLGTYHAAVANLVDTGILKTHCQSHHRRLLIDEKSANAFDQQYILVGALAKQLGLNSTNLAERLASMDIKPAPFHALVTIYRRADVQGLDCATVSATEAYQSKTGRKSTVSADRIDNPRVKKLIDLVERHGGAAAFLRKFGGSSGTLSQIMLGKKSFGLLAARRMEKRCGLKAGALGD